MISTRTQLLARVTRAALICTFKHSSQKMPKPGGILIPVSLHPCLYFFCLPLDLAFFFYYSIPCLPSRFPFRKSDGPRINR
jgi:hypothetical protein